VILTGETATLIMAFIGNPYLPTYNDLEFLHFDSSTSTFQTEVIRFFPDTNDKPKFLHQPSECVACHQSDTKPNWDSHNLWPGFYGSQLQPSPVEVEKFLSINWNSPRYRTLPSFQLDDFIGGRKISRNEVTGRMFAKLNAQRIVRRILSGELRNFRFALLAALSCPSLSPEELLPEELRKGIQKSFEKISVETEKDFNESFEYRAKFFKDLLGHDPQPNSSHESLAELAKVRFLVEQGAHSDMDGWSLNISQNSFDFDQGPGDFYGIRVLLYPLFLEISKDLKRDRRPSNYFDYFQKKSALPLEPWLANPQTTDHFLDSSHEEALCGYLKQKSQGALSVRTWN
jgi:hypothetical protein